MTDHIRSLSALAKTLTLLLPERRPAGRPTASTPRRPSRSRRELDALHARRAGSTSSAAAAARRRRTSRRSRRRPRARSRAASPIHNKTLVSGIELARGRRRQPARPRRRAHERARQPQVQAARSPTGSSRRRPRSRARRSRTARRSSTSASRTRTATRWPTSTRSSSAITQMVKVPLMLDSTDAKVLELGPQVEPGQVDPELDQPRGRRGALRDGRAARAALRRGARRRHDRRGPRARHGRHARAQARGRAAQLHAADREVRRSRPRTSSSTRSSSRAGRATRSTSAARSRRSRASALIKAAVPGVARRSSASPTSRFGLPESGREVLNSVFLYHCDEGRPRPRDREHREDRALSVDPRRGEAARRGPALQPRRRIPIAAFAEPLQGQGRGARRSRRRAPARRSSGCRGYILEGSKEGLVDDLEAVRTGGMAPLDIINGPLMDGMREVGRLFNANELIVAEVLQSAEAMKAAVTHLEKFMEKSTELAQGQGPPRDRQGRRPRHREEPRRDHPVEQRLRGRQPRHQGAAREARRGATRAPPGPDRPLGPARQERAADGHDGAGPDGRGRDGADARRRRGALAEVHGPPHRAGVRRPRRLRRGRDARPRPRRPDPLGRDGARGAARPRRDKRRAAIAAAARDRGRRSRSSAPAVRSTEVAVADPLAAPDLDEHVLAELDLAEVWEYLNPHMLYAKHLGLRGSYRKLKEAGDPKLAELERVIAKVQASGWIRARAMYRFFPAESEGNTLHLAVPGGGEACFTFPRQVGGRAAVPRRLRRIRATGRRRATRSRSSSRRPARACARGPRS